MYTTNLTPPCRDCGGSGRIRKVTIGKTPAANAETVACLCQGAITSLRPGLLTGVDLLLARLVEREPHVEQPVRPEGDDDDPDLGRLRRLAPGLKVQRSVYEPLALLVADRSGETMVRERNESRDRDAAAETPRSRIPDGLREFLTAEFDANRLDFGNVADTVARFDPTIAVLGVELGFCGNSINARIRCCSRGMTDNYDVELTFDCDPRTPTAPAPARIPDDSLLSVIAGKDGDR